MTAATAVSLHHGRPRSVASPARPQRRAAGYGLDCGLAALVGLPALAALAVLDVDPARAWLAAGLPVGGAIATVLARRHAVVAWGVLSVVLLGAAPSVYDLGDVAMPLWVSVAGTTPLIAVAAVACAVGNTVRLRWSAALLLVIGAIAVVSSGDDLVPILMLSIGWWAIGRVLRSRRLVTERLRRRTEELASEQQRHVEEAVRLERTTIARELHDVVAHCMTVVVLQARVGAQLVGRDAHALEEALDGIVGAAAEAESDLASLAALLAPGPTAPLTRELVDALAARVASTGTAVSTEITGDPSRVDPSTAAAVRRVLQEALTNALRHAPGAPVRIELHCCPPVVVSVENDAAPAGGLADIGAGRGLDGITERVSALQGRVDCGPTPSGGWRVEAVLPGI